MSDPEISEIVIFICEAMRWPPISFISTRNDWTITKGLHLFYVRLRLMLIFSPEISVSFILQKLSATGIYTRSTKIKWNIGSICKPSSTDGGIMPIEVCYSIISEISSNMASLAAQAQSKIKILEKVLNSNVIYNLICLNARSSPISNLQC